ncbi:hypothetical protein IJJ54_00205 [Candidatus Saccharibacteria bacterium]|nr:hypothetical protein [Candidatus Saccharibacteria bacterium]
MELDHIRYPGAEKHSSAAVLGEILSEQLKNYPDFYFFSPDETTSNRLSAVFESAERAWGLPRESWDLHLAPNGRIIELLSENTLFAVLAGHVLSGGRGAMTSYESFLPIISSQLDQYLKFLTQSSDLTWRTDVHALNLLSTSCWERQDHNGFTHQNPALISSLLAKPSNRVNCLFPIDDVAMRATGDFIFEQSKNVVNLTTFNKNAQPRWIDINHARFQFDNGGASLFQFTSEEDPNIVIAGIGDIPSTEALLAIRLAKAKQPQLRFRYVGINALSYGAIGTVDHKLSPATFDEYFTTDRPIIVNFHGYADTVRAIFANYTSLERVSVHGYEDAGSTTTPLDELCRNHCSRWDICVDIFEQLGYKNLADFYRAQISANTEYAKLHGVDQE